MRSAMVMRRHFNIVQACNRRHMPPRDVRTTEQADRESLIRSKINVRSSLTFLLPSVKVLSHRFFIYYPLKRIDTSIPVPFSCLQDPEASIVNGRDISASGPRSVVTSYSYTVIRIYVDSKIFDKQIARVKS